MRTAVAVASGHFGSDKLPEGFLLAVDGGYDSLVEHGYQPDLMIGDFDSVRELPEDLKKIRFPRRKNKTDLEIALDYLLEEEFERVYVYGAMGSRKDHEFMNLLFVKKYTELGLKVILLDEHNTITYERGRFEAQKKRDYISFLSLNPKGMVLSLKGFAYNLDREFIPFMSSRTISNEWLTSSAEVDIQDGGAFMIQSDKD